MKNAESLATVHTHTHTCNLRDKKINIDRKLCVLRLP